MNNKTFGVIGAMESEVAQLRAALSNAETREYSGLTFYSGTLGENRVVLVKSGIGKVNAARCTQILIDQYAPDCVINTGIAGGVGEGLAVADVVIGTELVQHDFDYQQTKVEKDKAALRATAEELTMLTKTRMKRDSLRTQCEVLGAKIRYIHKKQKEK